MATTSAVPGDLCRVDTQATSKPVCPCRTRRGAKPFVVAEIYIQRVDSLHTGGVVFYIAAMWIAGVMQGLMWRATNDDGTLTYTFVESLKATYPYYLARLGGGVLCLSGMVLMLVNVVKTLQLSKGNVDVAVPAPAHA